MRALRERLAAALAPGSVVQAPETLAELGRVLREAVADGDLVLLKGSNGMQLWQVVQDLVKLQDASPPPPPAVVIRRIAPRPLPDTPRPPGVA